VSNAVSIEKIMSPRPLRLAMMLHIVGNYYDHLRQGIADYHRLHGPWEFWHEAIQIMPNNLRLLREADGLITVIGAVRGSAERRRLEKFLIQSGKPVVEVSPGRSDVPFPQIRVDDVAVGRAAAEYLMSLGFSTFGFLGYPLAFSQDRFQGFAEGLAARGHRCLLPPPIEQWWNDRKESAARRRWFRTLPLPVAIFAATDAIAAQAMVAAQAEGILVPDQMALMGVDNGTLCDLSWPSLTSVPLDGVRAGFEAARLVHSLIRGDSAAQRQPMLIPPQPVIPRGSTDSLAIEDLDVIAAVRYIRQHVPMKLTAAQVVRHVAVSRRKLERRFQTLLHHTIGDEIRGAQTRRAMELLRSTPLTVGEIAEKTGFGSTAAFARMFKRIVKSTPAAYRAQTNSRASPPTPRRRRSSPVH
jgi:LacI family transcriptional regulator